MSGTRRGRGTEQQLAAIRREIDEIDQQLIRLLNRRAAASVEVARIKRGGNGRTYVPSREQDVLSNVLVANTGPLSEGHVRAIWGEILSSSRALQRPLRIAYLGAPGGETRHAAETAAHVRFGSFVEYVPARTLAEVFSLTERRDAQFGVVPVESSSDGSIGQTLDLLAESSVKICSEILLRIEHHLVGRGPLDDVRRVYAAPAALGHCHEWLAAHVPKAELVETSSAAAAAHHAGEEQGVAAIGNAETATEVDLRVLARSIQDQTNAFTRFLLLGVEIGAPSGRDKTSLMFTVRDHAGALFDVLSVFSKRQINLTRIESRPSRRQPWEYVFFVDFDGHPEEERTAAAFEEMQSFCTLIKVLGAWPAERRVDELSAARWA